RPLHSRGQEIGRERPSRKRRLPGASTTQLLRRAGMPRRTPTRRRFLASGLGALMASGGGLAGCGLADASQPERVWGVYGSKDGWLMKPRVAGFDAEDLLYIADLTDRIQVFDRTGQFLRCWRMPALNV